MFLAQWFPTGCREMVPGVPSIVTTPGSLYLKTIQGCRQISSILSKGAANEKRLVNTVLPHAFCASNNDMKENDWLHGSMIKGFIVLHSLELRRQVKYTYFRRNKLLYRYGISWKCSSCCKCRHILYLMYFFSAEYTNLKTYNFNKIS